VTQPANVDIEVHRAGRTFYPHYVVLLNQPGQELNTFLALQDWPALAGAAFLDLPELAGQRLSDIHFEQSQARSHQASSLDIDEETLKAKGFSDEQIRQYFAMQAELIAARQVEESASSPTKVFESLVARTGVPEPVWRRAGQEMLEAVLPLQSGTAQAVLQSDGLASGSNPNAAARLQHLGLERVSLVVDFPVTTATFGFSRVDYQPDRCQLNPFPPDRDHDGRYPILVDLVQADALLVRLDPARVGKWLELNGHPLALPPAATDQVRAANAYFVSLFDGVPLRETLRANRARERMVFGLLHSLNHLAIRHAALLCGLDRTSLSEYLQPRALTFALYCNHRFGATIGALASLYEQSLDDWLQSIRSADRCVYDPVCSHKGGSCHACMHLAETSCRFFNLNLTRSLLFGGTDIELGEIRVGYFDVP
jgi:hypothetical protein